MANKKKKNTTTQIMLMNLGSIFCGIVFACLTGLILIWMLFNVHPGVTVKQEVNRESTVDMSARMETYATNQKINILNDYLSENQTIRKIYKIEDGAPVPLPNQELFGSCPTSDVTPALEAIDRARSSGLLEGQDVVFNENLPFYERNDVQFYCDDTILAICWKEFVGGTVYSFMEVKIGDASQFRRKLAGDTYGASMHFYCTELTRQSGGVAGLNADYYAFRNLGVTCYEGTVYRCDNSLDTLFIDDHGDFIFLNRGFSMTKDEVQQFVDDNHIQFSLAFGPIIIRDGVLEPCTGYPIGQPLEVYSRAGIGQLDSLHYLYVNAEHHGEAARPTYVNTFAQVMYDHGVVQGYNMDGGQTGELVFNNKIYNLIDFNNERDVSDIIYFATAFPGGE